MNFIKIVGIVMVGGITLIVFNILFLGSNLGYGISKDTKTSAELANQAVTQEFKNINGNITISVPLKEKKGIRISNIAPCRPENDNNFYSIVDDNEAEYSSCDNDSCTISFKNKKNMPNVVSIYVREPGGVCKRTKFPTGSRLEIIGYNTKIEFTEALLNALNISGNSYEVSSINSSSMFSWQDGRTKTVVFSYEAKPSSDSIIINGNTKAKIIFSKFDGSKTTEVVATSYESGHFYSFECSSSTICTKTANVYIVSSDGIDVEVEEEFAKKCVAQKENNQPVNKYCKYLQEPGHSRTFTTSEDAMKHYIKYDGNPIPGDSLTNRRKALKQKIELSLIH